MCKNGDVNKLIEQLLLGELSAFDKLFENYSKKLYGFALRYLKSETEAEELVQDVFMKVWENRKKLKKDSSFSSYLFTIAYNNIKKYFRSNSYHKAYVKEIMSTSTGVFNFEERMDYTSVLNEVNSLIDKLPERRRTIFTKSRKEGLSSKEIAELLGLSPGTVDNNISEALKFIRKNLPEDAFALLLFFSLFLQ